MANTIQVKRSTGSSSPTGLAAGEIAWIDGGGGSGANGKLFIGDVADGSAQHIGGRGTGAIGGGAASSLAADDLSAGDAAVTLSTTSGNITIDATAGDSDIIFKGTDDSSDITMLTLDGSDAGHAIFNSRITAVGTSIFTNLDVSGDVDVDGTLEADAYTVAGDTLAEYIADTAGAMFASNTETGITATYQDADNTVDLVVGTLNQDTTGLAATATALATARTIGGTSFDGTANIAVSLAATATALATARNIGGVSFDGTGNISLVSGSIPDNAADTSGLAATATKIASITNTNIVQLTATQTLTNKTLTSPTLTGPALGTPASGTLTNCTFPSANVNTDVDVSVSNLETRLAAIDTATTIGNGVTMTAGGDFTVTGDLIVSGDTTTVNTATLSVEDPLIILASGNGADTVDVGLYAKYTASGVKYAGIVRDASVTGDPWTFFDSLTTEPTTTVTVGANGFDYADIKAGAIDAEDGFTGNLTGNASGSSATCTGLAATATALATARNIGGVSFDGTGNISLVSGSIPDNAADTSGLAGTATALATARTIGGTSFDGTANIAVSLAATATALATPRAINGTNFDGSAAITVTAAGSTLSDTVTVAKGGTGATTLTSGGVLLGSGTGAVTAMSVLANGEMIVGDGTTDPVAESGATLRTSIGCGATAGNGSLVTVGTVTSGTWAATDVGIAHGGTGASTAAAAATALGVGTGSSPQLTAINLGHASDTTIARVSAGVVSIEGVNIITANSTIDCGTF